MRTMAIAAVVWLVAAAGTLRADTLPLISPPTTYTPNVPVTFELRAPGLVDFSNFNVDLIVTTADPNAAPDLTLTAIRPDGNAYPFGPGGQFQATLFPGPAANQFDLNVTGSGPLTTTLSGTNDLIATISITPGQGLVGPIDVAFNPNSLQFAENPEFPQNFDPPASFDLSPPLQPAPVPAPAAWATFAIGGLTLAAARSALGRTCAKAVPS